MILTIAMVELVTVGAGVVEVWGPVVDLRSVWGPVVDLRSVWGRVPPVVDLIVC